MNRRTFLHSAAATAGLALVRPLLGKGTGATLTHKERVDRALSGKDLKPPAIYLLSPLQKANRPTRGSGPSGLPPDLQYGHSQSHE
jgi:hypothetical protein